MAARNAVSNRPAAPGHAIRVVLSGPMLIDEPSMVGVPMKVLQPAEPLMLPSSSNASVGTESPAGSRPSISINVQEVPSRPGVVVALGLPTPPQAVSAAPRREAANQRFITASIALDLYS